MALPSYINLAYILDQWNRSVAEDKIEKCPTRDWMKANLAHGTLDDLEAKIANDPVDGPGDCYAIIRDAYRYDPPEVAAEYQRMYAKHLVAFPFKVSRGLIEMLLHNPHNRGPMDPSVHKLLVDTILSNHRHPKKFFSQSNVATHLDFDPEKLPDDAI